MPTAASRPLSVFLCHSPDDKPTVRELYRRLNSEPWMDVWLDEEKLLPGQDWILEIEKAIEAADVILVCLTHNSVTKEGYIQRELRMVLDQAEYKPEGTLFVIPVRLEECALPRRLNFWQAADYFPVSDRDEAYARLLLSLRSRANDLGITISKPETLSADSKPKERQTGDPPQALSPTEIPLTPSQVEPDEGPWNQIHIQALENGSLTFTVISGEAKIEETVRSTQRALIDSLIEKVIRSPSWDQGLAASLFELIIPNRLKDLLRAIGNVVLVLNPDAASFPWEIIYDRRSPGAAPLATQIGMIRQLSSAPANKRGVEINNTNILVIGDPANLPEGFPKLPGAEQEARLVSEKFQQYKYQVDLEINTSASSIISRLYSTDYRVLHLAGHGVYRYAFKSSENEEPILYSGMPLGEGVFLTANEFKTLSYIPELVFINCPLSGVIDRPGKISNDSTSEFAVSLAQALIEMGVRAVVAPGWSIDDAAAITFADIFYDRMLKGETFGSAAKEARQRTYELHKDRTNTWAAYQCYGDPNYRLVVESDDSSHISELPAETRSFLDEVIEKPETEPKAKKLTRIEPRNLTPAKEVEVEFKPGAGVNDFHRQGGDHGLSPQYSNFDLEITRLSRGKYLAHVTASPAGEASKEFRRPFSDLELENFVLRIGRTRTGTRRLNSPEMQAAEAFGRKLFDTVFQDGVRECLTSSLHQIDRNEIPGLRLRLRLVGVPELGDLPWEYLYHTTLRRFLVLSARTPIIRYTDLPQPVKPLTIPPPLRLLVMVASPPDYPALDVEQERTKIEAALRSLEQRGLIAIEWMEKPTLYALQQRLRGDEVHLFHFIGHGGWDAQAQDGVLLFEDEQGHGRKVGANHLATILRDHQSLRLVVLNACEGGRASPTDPFAGVAGTLVQQGIPAVLAMQFEITDHAAIELAQVFYDSLATGYSAEAALAEARKTIYASGNDVEWGTPVLYLRAPEGKLFDIDTSGNAHKG